MRAPAISLRAGGDSSSIESQTVVSGRTRIMFFHSHLQRRKNGSTIPPTSRKRSGAGAQKKVARPLGVERLEERTLLSSSGPATQAVQTTYGQLPLAFEANQGQAAGPINFVARGAGYALSLMPTE